MRKIAGACALVSLALVQAGVVTADKDRKQLEEIIVTGEKLGRSLAETVTSISVFDESSIADQGDLELSELLRRAGNTTSNEEGKISIRGISQEGAGGGTGSPLISVQIDGVTLDDVSQQGASAELFDVEQVEVLRGAQSSSQGRNSLAGAVVISTREPTREFEAKTRLIATEHSMGNAAFAGGGPLSDSFAFRLTAIGERDPGFVAHVPRADDDFAETTKTLARVKLAFEPAYWAAFDSLLTFSTDERRGQPDYNIERGTSGTDPAKRRTSFVNEETRDDTQTDTLSWRNRYRFREGLELTSITSYMKTHQDYIRDFDGLEEDNGYNDIFEDGRNLTQEFRLNFESPGQYRGVVGLYAGRFDRDNVTLSGDIIVAPSFIAPVPGIDNAGYVEVDFVSEDAQKAKNLAFFSEMDIELPWRLTATLGLRYDHEELDQANRFDTLRGEHFLGSPETSGAQPGIDVKDILIASGAAPGTNGFRGGETDYQAWLPKAALRFAATDDWSVFVSYAEAYRAGGVDVNAQTGEAFPYDPEYTKNYETGVRGVLVEHGLDLAFNVFYTEWEDQQVPVLRGLFFASENAANSELYGFDLNLGWRVSDALSISASVGWVETEFLNYRAGDEDYSGNDFILAPKLTGGVSAVYRSTPLMASLSASYRDHSYTRPSNFETEFSEARTLVDTRIGWEGGSVAAYLFAYNLFDEDYITETYQFPNGYVGANTARGYAAYGRPREIGVQFEWAL